MEKRIYFTCAVCGKKFKIEDMYYNPLRGEKPYIYRRGVNDSSITHDHLSGITGEHGERVCKDCFSVYQNLIKYGNKEGIRESAV